MKNRIYLDYNATAPVRPAAIEAANKAMAQAHNASSVHSFGREARAMVEEARGAVAALCGVPQGQVIFNSGATETNNTVLKHFKGERILVSAIEHPAVLEAAPKAQRIPVTPSGTIDLDALEDLLKREKTALVSVMLVNNETGAIQPVKEIAALTHKYGALFHCDGVQAAGRIPFNVAESGIDFLSLSSHKIGGPQGAGALVLGLCGITPVLLHGGGQEKSARAGTENVPGIAGFGAAAKTALDDLSEFAKLATLQNKLETALKEIRGDIVIHAQSAPRVANTTMFSLPGASSETLMMALDLEGIAVSNGSACSSGTVKPSHVLKAMGCDDMLATSTLRISTGWATTEAEIERFLEAFTKIANRLTGKKTAHA